MASFTECMRRAYIEFTALYVDIPVRTARPSSSRSSIIRTNCRRSLRCSRRSRNSRISSHLRRARSSSRSRTTAATPPTRLTRRTRASRRRRTRTARCPRISSPPTSTPLLTSRSRTTTTATTPTTPRAISRPIATRMASTGRTDRLTLASRLHMRIHILTRHARTPPASPLIALMGFHLSHNRCQTRPCRSPPRGRVAHATPTSL
jgi:hypothetical protein